MRATNACSSSAMSRHPHPNFPFARITSQTIVLNPFNLYKAQMSR
jgi:hypothetical protein